MASHVHYNYARMVAEINISNWWFVHFWSLAVEEQFYLTWPFIVYLLSQKGLQKAAGSG